MFSTIFNSFSGFLDRRFILTAWLPSMLFWVGLLGLIVAHVGAPVGLGWWVQQAGEIQVLFIVLAVAWITFFAYLLAAQIAGLIRLYEGYWDDLPGGPWLAQHRKAYYREEIKRLSNDGDRGYFRIYTNYLPWDLRDQIMPTRLGNLLKNAELYSFVRYKIDAVLVWPRLYSVLPDRMVQNIGAAKSAMDLMVAISILGIAFALVGGLIALVLLPWYAFPACVWGGAAIAWLGYQGLLRQTLPYTQLIKAAFDLHRGTLLKTIGWEQPNSYGEERRRWLQIVHLWYRGAPEPAGVEDLGYSLKKQNQGATEDA
jgi:hypothetical protein